MTRLDSRLGLPHFAKLEGSQPRTTLNLPDSERCPARKRYAGGDPRRCVKPRGHDDPAGERAPTRHQNGPYTWT